ncbi:MAG: AAA family ATPase [Actinomycetia bacterium]|nr:AAA family ATPase [Actinomycetes bacterium]
MQKVAFVGCSGAGKTTLARLVAERLGVEHIELDAMFHQPGWTRLEGDEFKHRVEERLAAAGSGWTCDGNYESDGGYLVRRAADTIVWSWTRFDNYRGRYEEMLRGDAWAHADIVRLRTTAGTSDWLDGVGS